MIKQDGSNDGNVINISTYNEVNNEFLNDIYKIAGIKNCEFVSDNQFNATIEWINYNDMRVCNMVLPPGRLVREVAQVAGKAPCFVVVAAQNGALRLTLEQGSHDVAGERIVVFDARTLSSIDLIAGEDGRCTFQWLELSSITDFAGAMKGEAASIESVSLREYVHFFPLSPEVRQLPHLRLCGRLDPSEHRRDAQDLDTSGNWRGCQIYDSLVLADGGGLT